VRGVRGGERVGLPDIHLRAAGSVLATPRIGIVRRGLPAVKVGLTIDPFDVVRALSIAITSTVLGTSFVIRELGRSAISIHCHKVEGPVKSTREIRHVCVERELLILQLEHHVLSVGGHIVDTRANIGRVRSMGDKPKSNSFAV